MNYKTSKIYDYNVCNIKKMGGRYKVTLMSACLRGGFEKDGFNEREHITTQRRKNNHDTDYVKLQHSISRTKNTIQEYLMCNDWKYFITLTLDKDKFDRYDLDKFKKELNRFIDNRNKTRKNKLKYLLIFERHKDGAWHLHGVVEGLEDDELEELDQAYFDKYKNGKVPKYILKKWEKGQKVYTWKKYSEKFGYVTLDEIRDKNRISSYMRKYITKDMADSVKECDKHLYMASRGLKKAEKISKGHLPGIDELLKEIDPTTSNYVKGEYVRVIWLDATEENEQLIGSYFEPFNFNDITMSYGRYELKDLLNRRYMRDMGWRSVDFVDVSELFEKYSLGQKTYKIGGRHKSESNIIINLYANKENEE